MKEEPEGIIRKLNNIIEGDFKKALEKMQNYDYEYYGLKLISNENTEEELNKLHKKWTIENLREKGYNLDIFH